MNGFNRLMADGRKYYSLKRDCTPNTLNTPLVHGQILAPSVIALALLSYTPFMALLDTGAIAVNTHAKSQQYLQERR
jgi:hypothetical protein